MDHVAAHHAILNIFEGPLTLDDIWLIVGFLGQGLFFGRFLVQWIVSERSGRSVIPDLFWYFSIGGGAVLFAYALHKQDPVFIWGQGIGLFVYVRNIMLVNKERKLARVIDQAAGVDQ